MLGTFTRAAFLPSTSLPFLRLYLDHHRRPAEPECLAQLVGQVALVGEVQRAAAVGEQNECRRPNGCLRDILDLALFKIERLDEPVQLAGGNALRSRFVSL